MGQASGASICGLSGASGDRFDVQLQLGTTQVSLRARLGEWPVHTVLWGCPACAHAQHWAKLVKVAGSEHILDTCAALSYRRAFSSRYTGSRRPCTATASGLHTCHVHESLPVMFVWLCLWFASGRLVVLLRVESHTCRTSAAASLIGCRFMVFPPL